jgi:hypothetical protein
MADVDDILAGVRQAPVPSGLGRLDSLVIEAVVAHRNSPEDRPARPIALAAIGALVIGLVGALPGKKVEAAGTAFAIGEVPALAPSHLLASN